MSLEAPGDGGAETFSFFLLRRIMDGGKEERNLLTVAMQHLLSYCLSPVAPRCSPTLFDDETFHPEAGSITEPPAEAPFLQRSKK